MSKANRTKGVFNQLLGCRTPSQERINSLAQREQGITERHTPTKSTRVLPKITKSQRKFMLKSKAPVEHHKNSKLSMGYVKVMGLVTAAITTPEVSLV